MPSIGISLKNSGSLSIQPETERNLNTCMRSRVRTRTHGSVRGRHPCFRRVPPTRRKAAKDGGGSERRRPGRSMQEACFWYASLRTRIPKRALSNSEEKPPRMAAEANEGGPEEACRRLASGGGKGKNRSVRPKSDRLRASDRTGS